MPFIYRIANRTSDDVYYGSTTQSLKERFRGHFKPGNRSHSKLITSCPTAYIELVEEVSVEDKVARERWWVENNPCVNKQLPGRSNKDSNVAWKAVNREKYNAYQREYQRANRAKKNAVV